MKYRDNDTQSLIHTECAKKRETDGKKEGRMYRMQVSTKTTFETRVPEPNINTATITARNDICNTTNTEAVRNGGMVSTGRQQQHAKRDDSQAEWR